MVLCIYYAQLGISSTVCLLLIIFRLILIVITLLSSSINMLCVFLNSSCVYTWKNILITWQSTQKHMLNLWFIMCISDLLDSWTTQALFIFRKVSSYSSFSLSTTHSTHTRIVLVSNLSFTLLLFVWAATTWVTGKSKKKLRETIKYDMEIDRKKGKRKTLSRNEIWVSGRTEIWDIVIDPKNCSKTKTKII